MKDLASYWDTIIICDNTLIQMGYGPFFNDKDPMTEHEFTMLFKEIMGTVDCYHMALLFGKPKYAMS